MTYCCCSYLDNSIVHFARAHIMDETRHERTHGPHALDLGNIGHEAEYRKTSVELVQKCDRFSALVLSITVERVLKWNKIYVRKVLDLIFPNILFGVGNLPVLETSGARKTTALPSQPNAT